MILTDDMTLNWAIYRETRKANDSQAGKGLIKVNGRPLQLVQPEVLRFKVRTIPIRTHLH